MKIEIHSKFAVSWVNRSLYTVMSCVEITYTFIYSGDFAFIVGVALQFLFLVTSVCLSSTCFSLSLLAADRAPLNVCGWVVNRQRSVIPDIRTGQTTALRKAQPEEHKHDIKYRQTNVKMMKVEKCLTISRHLFKCLHPVWSRIRSL